MRATKTTAHRLYSLDILRTIAILLMVQVHFVQNLSPREAGTSLLYDLSVWLGMIPAPLFTFLAGLSLQLWLSREITAGKIRAGTAVSRGVKRGIALFIAGLVFAVVIWFPYEIFDWDILTLIGTATLVLLAVRRAGTPVLALACLVLAFASPQLRAMAGYAGHWQGIEYHYTFSFRDVLSGFLVNGYFPVFPWLMFPVAGFMAGRLFYGPGGTRRRWMLPAGGLALICASILLLAYRVHSGGDAVGGITFYPASSAYVAGILGIILLALRVLSGMYDGMTAQRGGPVEAFFTKYSKYSLTTYVVHHAVHVWPMYAVALIKGGPDIEGYYANAVSTPAALFLVVVFVAVFYPILGWMERRKWHGLEGAIRWGDKAR